MNLRLLSLPAVVTAGMTLWLHAAAAAVIPEIVCQNGKKFTQCEITRIAPDGIEISHSGGAARIPYEIMPDDLRKQCRLTDESVAAHRRKQGELAKKQAAAKPVPAAATPAAKPAAAKAPAVRKDLLEKAKKDAVRLKIADKKTAAEGGLVVAASELRQVLEKEGSSRKYKIPDYEEYQGVTTGGNNTVMHSNDHWVNGKIRGVVTKRRPVPQPRSGTIVENGQTIKRKVSHHIMQNEYEITDTTDPVYRTEEKPLESPVFIVGLPENAGAGWIGALYPAGRKKLSDGTQETVYPQYVTSPELLATIPPEAFADSPPAAAK